MIQNVLEHPYERNIMKIYNLHSIEPMEITEGSSGILY